MARRTKEEAQETRTLILDTAEQVFRDRGVSRTSLAEIAQRAGVTRGAIYWHFQDKADLFTAMCDRATLPLEALMENMADPDQPDPLGLYLHGGDRLSGPPGAIVRLDGRGRDGRGFGGATRDGRVRPHLGPGRRGRDGAGGRQSSGEQTRQRVHGQPRLQVCANRRWPQP